VINGDGMKDWVEVNIGDFAKEGDKVLLDGDSLILNEVAAQIHNEFEPEGYSKDSYKRLRRNDT
jgi:hypothetical protein